MPKGPKGEKRPADVVGAAVAVARIATGEATEQSFRNDVDKTGGESRQPIRTIVVPPITSNPRQED